jgi:geranylgeranyl reductase family protein
VSAVGSKRLDLAIVGAGPAGSAAAIRARQLGLSVLLLDQHDFPRAKACLGWVSPAGVVMAESCGLTPASAGADEFCGLTLHSWDLRKQTAISERALRGWIVDRSRFDLALLKAARELGAEALLRHAVDGLRLGEREVEIDLAGERTVCAALLIIADGTDSTAARLARITPARALADLPRTFYGEFAAKGEPRLDVAIGQGRTGQLAVIARSRKRVCIGLSSRADEESVSRQYAAFVAAAVEADLLPKCAAGPATCVVTPAGAALEMDAHVGKRCVLVGDAGGFVAAFSNEGIYPAMKSGWIAAETVARTLNAAYPQDELATFDESWRTALAEYLRRPNTDLSLLMPLVFGNEQMARRIARAFLLGQAF